MSRENLNASFAGLLAQLRNEKQSATKSAGLGETSHPVMGADAGTKPTTEGERSRENERDLKEQETTMAAESASPPPGGNQEDLNTKFGPVAPKETGHDPGSETGSAKDTKQDPGTSHPAKVAYSSDSYQKEAASLTEQLNQVSKSAEQLLRVLLDAKQSPDTPQTKAAGTTDTQTTASTNKSEVEKAAAAGQDLANVFANMNITPEDKQASDRYVFDLVRQAIAAGVHSADQYVKVASGFFAQKQANDDEGASPAVEEESEEGSEPSEGGSDGGSDDAASDEGGTGPEISDDSMPSEEEIIALLTGQGMSPEGGEGMPPDAGGMGGGAPDAMMGGGGGGGELDPELIQALLAELQAGGGGEMGGGAPPAGGAPPMMDPAAMGGDPMAGKMAAKKAAAKQVASAIVKIAGKQAVSGKAAKAARNSQAQKMLMDLIGR